MPHLSESFGISGLLALTTTKETGALSREDGCKLTRPLFILLIICFFCSAAFGQPWDGNGVEGDPYLIYDACDMQAIGADANYWDAHFKLMADINLIGIDSNEFNIIGYKIYLYGQKAFEGTFDGNGHTISNFTYYDPDRDSAGIFGYTSSICVIKNLHLRDVNITGDYYVGGLVGLNYGTVENCSVTGIVCGTENVGGLVGMNHSGSSIKDCNSNISLLNQGYLFAAGGLVGYNFEGDVIDCSSSGNIYGGDDSYMLGGLAGFNRGRIRQCYSTADVNGLWYIGGLIGEHDWYELVACYATGDIWGEDGCGGLIGRNYCDVSYCYATGNVENTGYGCGGLIGENWWGDIRECYSAGNVVGVTYVGGLVGTGDLDTQFINCFWDVNTSGQTDSFGGIGLTTNELQSQEILTSYGWDFVGPDDGPDNIWFMLSGEYPVLYWQIDSLNPLPTFSGGSGTVIDPYLISNPDDLYSIGHNPKLMECCFKLVNNIDLNSFPSISISNVSFPFRGLFDGDGHIIFDFNTIDANEDYLGFVCKLDNAGTIRDIGLDNTNVIGRDSVGGIVGSNAGGEINGCFVNGKVAGRDYVGGVCGNVELNGKVQSCYSNVQVTGEDMVGGLVGRVWDSSLLDSYSVGMVDGSSYVGGLTGRSQSDTVYLCYWDVNSSGTDISSNGKGKTQVQLKQRDTFLGWHYDNKWKIDDGNDYPRLIWEDTNGDLIIEDVNRYGGGSGTPEDPYRIYNWRQLSNIGFYREDFFKDFVLMSDVNMSEIGPDYLWSIGTSAFPFEGTFNGNGHKFHNLNIESSNYYPVGLFGYVGSNSIIKNTEVYANIITGTGTGLIASVVNGGKIISCYGEGSILGGASGGIVSRLNGGIIENCQSLVDINSRASYLGGICGFSDKGQIISCTRLGGTLTNTFPEYAYGTGGIVGRSISSTIKDCKSFGNINGTIKTGGIVGYGSGIIQRCLFTGSIVASGYYTGGIIGYSFSTITGCASEGSVQGTAWVGGIAGRHAGRTISNCYAIADVTASNTYSGGFAGYQYNAINENCYVAAEVTSTGGYKSPWTGQRSSTSYIGCFWDKDRCSLSVSSIIGQLEGKTTAEMKVRNTFIAAGWDFVDETDNGIEDIWRLCNEGTEYPQLNWEYPLGDFGCPDGVDWSDLAILCGEWLFEELSADVGPDGGDGFVNFFDWAIFADGWQITHDIFDLADFADQWLKTGSNYLIADIAPAPDGDGIVNMVDYTLLAENWMEGH